MGNQWEISEKSVAASATFREIIYIRTPQKTKLIPLICFPLEYHFPFRIKINSWSSFLWFPRWRLFIDISECDRSTLDSDYIPSDSSMDGFEECDVDNWMMEVEIASDTGSVPTVIAISVYCCLLLITAWCGCRQIYLQKYWIQKTWYLLLGRFLSSGPDTGGESEVGQ